MTGVKVTNMEDGESQRLYRIQSEPSHFYAGYIRNGNQVLMRVETPYLAALEFDGEGNFLGQLKKEISPETMSLAKESRKQKTSHLFYEDWKELDRWAAELGLTKFVITIPLRSCHFRNTS